MACTNRTQSSNYDLYPRGDHGEKANVHSLDPLPRHDAERPIRKIERTLQATTSTIDEIQQSLGALSFQDGDSAGQLSVTKATLVHNSVRLKNVVQTAWKLVNQAEEACEKAKRAGEEGEAKANNSINEVVQKINELGLQNPERQKLLSAQSRYEDSARQVQGILVKSDNARDKANAEKIAAVAEKRKLETRVQQLERERDELQLKLAENDKLTPLMAKMDGFDQSKLPEICNALNDTKEVYRRKSSKWKELLEQSRQNEDDLTDENERLKGRLAVLEDRLTKTARALGGQIVTPSDSFRSRPTGESSSGEVPQKPPMPSLPFDNRHWQSCQLFPNKAGGMTHRPSSSNLASASAPQLEDPFGAGASPHVEQDDSRSSQRHTAMDTEPGDLPDMIERREEAAARASASEQARRVPRPPARLTTHSEQVVSPTPSVTPSGFSTAARSSTNGELSKIPRPQSGSRQRTRFWQHTSVVHSTRLPVLSKTPGNVTPDPKRQKTTHKNLVGHGHVEVYAGSSATMTGAAPQPTAIPQPSSPVRPRVAKRKANRTPTEGIDDLLRLLQVKQNDQFVQASTLPGDVQATLKPLLEVYMEKKTWYATLSSNVVKPTCAHDKLSHRKVEAPENGYRNGSENGGEKAVKCLCEENDRLHIQLERDTKTIVPMGDETAGWDEVRYWVAQRDTAASSPSSW